MMVRSVFFLFHMFPLVEEQCAVTKPAQAISAKQRHAQFELNYPLHMRSSTHAQTVL